ncbi:MULTISPECIES: magnesium-translocating P-type ATPase [Sporomusa]|uniref:magnesium-translocating P-type ATPase n=1 Tax=Sporomusa TaxID=2375 RepID=UPI001662F0EE|nr:MULTISPECIES: magnesium-translocating P-type ATPase [Sporomusa]HML34765.1 magnesium-translocating P-type ATPase [Sporomusa sphaeroides]
MNKASLLNDRMKKYAHSDTAALYNDLGITRNGLRLEQVEAMKKKYGDNNIFARKADTIWFRIRRAFINPFTIILFVLAIVSFITDVWHTNSLNKNATTVIIISVIILISGVVRFIQEIRSKHAYDQLDRLVHTHINVKRDGVIIKIPAENLVVGDRVYLAAGDRVPADMRLINTMDLFVSQSAITGESGILEKTSRKHDYMEQMAFLQYENLVFMGTSVISGKGEGIVLAVGKETLYGNFIQPNALTSNSFEKGANSIAWVLLRFMIVLVPIVFIISGITQGNWTEAFLFALSVAVGLTPEMLPMVITACLAKGSTAMFKKQTIIKDINAMQVFGSMDILCMDKTGTLTNVNILLEYYMDILGNESKEVLRFAYLNSLYHSGVKNPIDKAILECRNMPQKSEYYETLAKQYTKVDEIPFDYTRKYVSTLIADDNGSHQLIMKGDVEAVFSRCTFVEYQGTVHPILEDGRSSVAAVVDEMLEDGMKVIAVARKDLGNQNTVSLTDEANMVLLGYLAFFDAPKKSAAQSIAKLKNLQVETKILTGDHQQIAISICSRIGIASENMLTGADVNRLSDLELRYAVEKTSVFAELSPSQKVRIVTALRENGHTVGFLGDGLNDIPAICEADVGISVDTAVDAAKDVADVILLQKDLNVLEEGILEGRKTFANMSKYIKITASSNFGNILSIVCASAFLPFLPMAAIQILLLNLLYDILCIVLPWDHVDQEVFSSPREWSGKTLGRFMRFFGPISSIFDGITFLFLYFVLCPALTGGLLYTQLTDPAMQFQYIALFQTGWFLESMWTQVLIIHMLRTQKIPFLQSRPSTPVMLITIIGILLFTGLTFTPIVNILGLTVLPLWYFGFLLVVVASYMLLTTVWKRSYVAKYGELI